MRLLWIIGAGFLAGAIAVLAVQQPALGFFQWLGWTQGVPYRMNPTQPFGIAQIWSFAFFGGLWGIVLAWAASRQRFMPVLLFGFVFGAILLPLVGWFVVAPLRGQPVAQGFVLSRMWFSPLINGIWGFGAAFFWRAFARGT